MWAAQNWIAGQWHTWMRTCVLPDILSFHSGLTQDSQSHSSYQIDLSLCNHFKSHELGLGSSFITPLFMKILNGQNNDRPSVERVIFRKGQWHWWTTRLRRLIVKLLFLWTSSVFHGKERGSPFMWYMEGPEWASCFRTELQCDSFYAGFSTFRNRFFFFPPESSLSSHWLESRTAFCLSSQFQLSPVAATFLII